MQTIWLTGLSGAGKSTLAHALRERLEGIRVPSLIIDGDILRAGLCQELGYSAADRAENVRRAAEVARLANGSGIVAIVALISPFRSDRARAREICTREGGTFHEVHVATSLPVCESRDPKGLYRKARAGTLQGLTGVDAPYEYPDAPALRIDTDAMTVSECVDQIGFLLDLGRLEVSAMRAMDKASLPYAVYRGS